MVWCNDSLQPTTVSDTSLMHIPCGTVMKQTFLVKSSIHPLAILPVHTHKQSTSRWSRIKRVHDDIFSATTSIVSDEMLDYNKPQGSPLNEDVT